MVRVRSCLSVVLLTLGTGALRGTRMATRRWVSIDLSSSVERLIDLLLHVRSKLLRTWRCIRAPQWL